MNTFLSNSGAHRRPKRRGHRASGDRAALQRPPWLAVTRIVTTTYRYRRTLVFGVAIAVASCSPVETHNRTDRELGKPSRRGRCDASCASEMRASPNCATWEPIRPDRRCSASANVDIGASAPPATRTIRAGPYTGSDHHHTGAMSSKFFTSTQQAFSIGFGSSMTSSPRLPLQAPAEEAKAVALAGSVIVREQGPTQRPAP